MSASRLAIAVGLASIACSALAPMALAQATSTARIVSIAAGQNTSYAVDDAGHVWSWGLYSAWIDARAEGASLVPARVPGIDDAVSVSASFLSVCVVRRSHPVTCWRSSSEQRELAPPFPAQLDQLEVGGDATCARTGTSVRCVGTGTDPTRFAAARDVAFLEVTMREMFAVTRDGRLLCTGAGVYDPCLRGREDDDAPIVPIRMPSSVARIATSGVNHCATLVSGEVRCWGRDVTAYDEAQSWHRVPPRAYPALAQAEEIVITDRTACARSSDGRVTCVPLNDGATSYVPLASGAMQLAAGYEHVCARTSEGGVACWGRGVYGEIGDGTGQAHPTATRVATDIAQLFVTSEGVYTIDRRGHGTRLRDPESPRAEVASFELPHGARAIFLPRVGVLPLDARGRVTWPTRDAIPYTAYEARERFPDADRLYAMGELTCGFTDATLRCSGLAGLRRDETFHSVRPDQPIFTDVTELSASTSGFVCARDRSGVVRCLGGLASGGNVYSDVIEIPWLRGATSIAAGHHAVCGIVGGSLHCGGLFGIDPTQPVPGTSDVVEVALGERHGCARSRSGEVFCFGNDDSGQLGAGDLRPREGAVRVAGVSGAVAIGCADASSCALLGSGEVLCWGDDTGGRIGLPDVADRRTAAAARF
ncbi:MAG: hypothetical protein J0L92_27630 [Deltaproteobacteria bacterium]|nr:hypothetical protein [Deltaproteobacteria bacterium]